ncbi:MAG: NAD(+) synthase [Candidatus Falkowbacteria bacterium]
MTNAKNIILPSVDPALVVREIGDFIVSRVRSQQATGAVVGLSGGVDSSLTAALAAKAFKGHADLELIGYILPSKVNVPADIDDGREVAEKLGIRHEIHDLESAVEGFRSSNPEAFSSAYHKGNLISRVRANVLNTKAATEKKVLLGTGNKDEDYGIGYYTLFGDGAVHLSPIGSLSKRLVRELAAYLGFERIARRAPTAGLEPGQTDFKDLGYDYDVVELVIEGLDQGIAAADLSSHPQVAPLIEAGIERWRKEFGEPRLNSPAEVIGNIIERHQAALVKGRLVSPEIAKVTLEYS